MVDLVGTRRNSVERVPSTDGLSSPHAPSLTDYLGLSAVAGPVRFNHATGTAGGSGANINHSSFGRSDIEAALKALNANPHKKFEGFGPQFDRAYPRVAELLKEAPKHGGGPTSAALIAMEKACLEIRDQERRVRKSGNELGANMIAAAAPIYRLLAMTAGQMENHYAVTAINLAIDRGDILNKQRGSLAKSQGAQSSLTFGDKLLIGLGYVPSCALLGTTAWIALSNSSWGSTEIIQGLAGVGMSVVAAAINYGYAKKLEDTRS